MLVGFDHADDAGVYQIAPNLALVQTVDFFTPIVDDPYTFGQIAASNALSDVYAMGGRPLTSLAMVCFPEKGDLEILERILAGGLAKMMEAGCTVIGGHSIRDDETKFGYSVTDHRVHAMTDITGFGLIGHARELALASRVLLRLYSANIPLLPGAIECVRAGYIPGGLKNNRDFAECLVAYADGIEVERKTLLYDPQTAGGLLISLEREAAEALVRELIDLGLPASCIGDVQASAKPAIEVS